MADAAPLPWWKRPAFWAVLTVVGTVLGATCPLWPAPAQVFCQIASRSLQAAPSVLAPAQPPKSETLPRCPLELCHVDPKDGFMALLGPVAQADGGTCECRP